MFRCALTVPYEAEVNEELLRAVADASGKEFSLYGSGMFGTEVLAELYSDESDDLLIEARAVEVPVKAVLVRTQAAEDAIAIRQVVGSQLGGWSEQMIRAQLEDQQEGDPRVMVALVMAAGGGPIERESLDLLKRAAAAKRKKNVRTMAEYALRVAADLADSPIVNKEQKSELPEVLRPSTATVGAEDHWITARPGVASRQIPRPVTWLRRSGVTSKQAIHPCCSRWFFAIMGRTTSEWYENIWTTLDSRTAIHFVEHPALKGEYIAVHGADVTAVVAALTAAGDIELLDAPPNGLSQTAP